MSLTKLGSCQRVLDGDLMEGRCPWYEFTVLTMCAVGCAGDINSVTASSCEAISRIADFQNPEIEQPFFIERCLNLALIK